MESERRPVAGVDYPRTFQEMDDWFRDEAACRDYVRRLRWPAGFVCSARIRAASSRNISTTTSTSSLSASIVAAQRPEACSSIGSPSRPSPSTRRRIARSLESPQIRAVLRLRSVKGIPHSSQVHRDRSSTWRNNARDGPGHALWRSKSSATCPTAPTD